MTALDLDPDLYDRKESLGEALEDEPMPWDEEYWGAVLAPQSERRRRTRDMENPWTIGISRR